MRTRCEVGLPLSLCPGQILDFTDLSTCPSAGKLLPQEAAPSRRTRSIAVVIIVSSSL